MLHIEFLRSDDDDEYHVAETYSDVIPRIGETVLLIALHNTEHYQSHEIWRVVDVAYNCACSDRGFTGMEGGNISSVFVYVEKAECFQPSDTWLPLGELDDGAVFETKEGVRAVKSEYYYTMPEGKQHLAQCQCVLLGSGEYAHFPKGNATLVRRIL